MIDNFLCVLGGGAVRPSVPTSIGGRNPPFMGVPPGAPAPELPSFSEEVEDEANTYFQRIYNQPPHQTLSIDEVLDILKRFKDSNNRRERVRYVSKTIPHNKAQHIVCVYNQAVIIRLVVVFITYYVHIILHPIKYATISCNVATAVWFQEVFSCMLRNLFDENKFFPQYPERELHITALLFGGIIEQGLVQ